MVWEVITDSGNFTVWDSGISQIDGELRHGGTIRVRARTGGSHRLRLRVRQVPGREMTWTGGLPLGLFTGRRTFTLTPHAGATLLHIREEYTGPLVGLLGASVPKIERDIAGYVSAVKKRAELLGRYEARILAPPDRSWLGQGNGPGQLGTRDSPPQWRPALP